MGARAFARQEHVSVALPSCLETVAGLNRFALRETGGRHRHLRVLDKTVKLRGLELFQRFVRSPATIRIQPEQIEVRLRHRARNLLHIAAGFREDRPAMRWLGGKPMRPLIGLQESNLSQTNRQLASQTTLAQVVTRSGGF